MFEDTVKSIKAYLYDKTVSPLCGAFVVSWLFVNHRFVMAIIFGEGVDGKFKEMDSIIQSYSGFLFISGWCLNFIILPLLFSLIYIYLYPYPAKLIYSYSKKRQMELNSLKNELEGLRLLTVEESRELRRKHFELEGNYQKDIQSMTTEIAFFKKELNNKEIEINILKEEEEKFLKEYHTLTSEFLKIRQDSQDSVESDLEVDNTQIASDYSIVGKSNFTEELISIDDDIGTIGKLLVFIGSEGSISNSELRSSLVYKNINLERIKLEYLLEKLAEHGYIDISYYEDASYRLTSKGKEYLVRSKLV